MIGVRLGLASPPDLQETGNPLAQRDLELAEAQRTQNTASKIMRARGRAMFRWTNCIAHEAREHSELYARFVNSRSPDAHCQAPVAAQKAPGTQRRLNGWPLWRDYVAQAEISP